MKMTKQSTHTGTCQICGGDWALPNGLLSKHGYVVPHGYFVGVCIGAHHQPLELSRKLADEVAADLDKDAERLNTLAIEIAVGNAKPAQAKAGFSCKDRDNRWTQVLVPFADADKHYQREAVESFLWNTQSRAKQATDIAKAIRTRADRVTGKHTLRARSDVPARKVIVPGCHVTVGGKRYLVADVQDREQRSWTGRNSRFCAHYAVDNSKGQRFWSPCGSVRQDKIEL